jgi:predicted dithiol-disulfide oxidoreductase (DUF899 family)
MALPDIVTREEWLAARTRLLALEKEEPKGRAPRLHGPDPTFTD